MPATNVVTMCKSPQRAEEFDASDFQQLGFCCTARSTAPLTSR